MYVYIESEKGLYTVGFYRPDTVHEDQKWVPESDHESREKAAERVAWLNGSGKRTDGGPKP